MGKYEPPKCLKCGAKLEDVNENDYCVYSFDCERGCYAPDGYIEIHCPWCGADLHDMPEFESGACNYHIVRQRGEGRGGEEVCSS